MEEDAEAMQVKGKPIHAIIGLRKEKLMIMVRILDPGIHQKPVALKEIQPLMILQLLKVNANELGFTNVTVEEDSPTYACQKIQSKICKYKPRNSNIAQHHITNKIKYKANPFNYLMSETEK